MVRAWPGQGSCPQLLVNFDLVSIRKRYPRSRTLVSSLLASFAAIRSCIGRASSRLAHKPRVLSRSFEVNSLLLLSLYRGSSLLDILLFSLDASWPDEVLSVALLRLLRNAHGWIINVFDKLPVVIAFFLPSFDLLLLDFALKTLLLYVFWIKIVYFLLVANHYIITPIIIKELFFNRGNRFCLSRWLRRQSCFGVLDTQTL